MSPSSADTPSNATSSRSSRERAEPRLRVVRRGAVRGAGRRRLARRAHALRAILRRWREPSRTRCRPRPAARARTRPGARPAPSLRTRPSSVSRLTTRYRPVGVDAEPLAELADRDPGVLSDESQHIVVPLTRSRGAGTPTAGPLAAAVGASARLRAGALVALAPVALLLARRAERRSIARARATWPVIFAARVRARRSWRRAPAAPACAQNAAWRALASRRPRGRRAVARFRLRRLRLGRVRQAESLGELAQLLVLAREWLELLQAIDHLLWKAAHLVQQRHHEIPFVRTCAHVTATTGAAGSALEVRAYLSP